MTFSSGPSSRGTPALAVVSKAASPSPLCPTTEGGGCADEGRDNIEAHPQQPPVHGNTRARSSRGGGPSIFGSAAAIATQEGPELRAVNPVQQEPPKGGIPTHGARGSYDTSCFRYRVPVDNSDGAESGAGRARRRNANGDSPCFHSAGAFPDSPSSPTLSLFPGKIKARSVSLKSGSQAGLLHSSVAPVPSPHRGRSSRSVPASPPSTDAEFVAPGVSKATARTLLHRILDINEPTIQEKMVDFLLIDGVIATLLEFVTCVDDESGPDSDCKQFSLRPASPPDRSLSLDPDCRSDCSLKDKLLPQMLLDMQRKARQHQRRIRNRNRGADLSPAQLKRAYNAVRMLTADNSCSKRILDLKLSVIIYCLFNLFHWRAQGSFHHFALMIDCCLSRSPVRVCRMLLTPPSDTDTVPPPPQSIRVLSSAYEQGKPLIQDLFPYLSEPPVQQIFYKVVFSAWSGSMLTAIGLDPSDAIVASESLAKLGLSGNILASLGHGAHRTDSSRERGLEILHSRFAYLHEAQFFPAMVELMDDDDPDTVRGAASLLGRIINECSLYNGIGVLYQSFVTGDHIVRRMAQSIVDTTYTRTRISPKSEASTRVLHALLRKTSCRYGRLTRMLQSVRDPDLGEGKSEQLLAAGMAARAELETFIPGILAQIVGLQGYTDLTTNATNRQRGSIYSLSHLVEQARNATDKDAKLADLLDYKDPLQANNDNNDLGPASNAFATPKDNSASSSLSSSLSPSSTLSATSRPAPDHIGPFTSAAQSSLPNIRPADFDARYSPTLAPNADSKEWIFLQLLPRLTQSHVQLLELVYEVLNEADDLDEIVGWVDVRVWAGLASWYLQHPNNDSLHSVIYKLISLLVRWSSWWHRQVKLYLPPPPPPSDDETCSPGDSNVSTESDSDSAVAHIPLRPRHTLPRGRASRVRAVASNASDWSRLEDASSTGTGGSGPHRLFSPPLSQVPPEEAAAAEQASSQSSTPQSEYLRQSVCNCDRVITYLVERVRLVERLIASIQKCGPNIGSRGFSLLILNTLRLGIETELSMHQGGGGREGNRGSPGVVVGVESPMGASEISATHNAAGSYLASLPGSARTAPPLGSSNKGSSKLDMSPSSKDDNNSSKVGQRHRGHSRHSSLVNEDEFEGLVFMKPKSKSTTSLESWSPLSGVDTQFSLDDSALTSESLSKCLGSLSLSEGDTDKRQIQCGPSRTGGATTAPARSATESENGESVIDSATKTASKSDPVLSYLHRWQLAIINMPEWNAFLPHLCYVTTQQTQSTLPFTLVDQSRRVIANCSQRPFPNFSPINVKLPGSLENVVIRSRRLRQQMLMLIGAPSNLLLPTNIMMRDPVPTDTSPKVDEQSIWLNSAFALALGFGLESAEVGGTDDGQAKPHPTARRKSHRSVDAHKTVGRRGSSVRRKASTPGRKRSKYVNASAAPARAVSHPLQAGLVTASVKSPSGEPRSVDRATPLQPISINARPVASKLESATIPEFAESMSDRPEISAAALSPQFKPSLSVKALAQQWEANANKSIAGSGSLTGGPAATLPSLPSVELSSMSALSVQQPSSTAARLSTRPSLARRQSMHSARHRRTTSSISSRRNKA